MSRQQSAESVRVPIAQLELILWALEGFLNLFVEDWRADAPVAKQPWAGNANECWNAIGQARVLCEIIERTLMIEQAEKEARDRTWGDASDLRKPAHNDGDRRG